MMRFPLFSVPVGPARLPGALVVLLLLAFALLARPAAAVEIKRVVSPGGIEAWLVEDHKIPVVALEWVFADAGGRDPAGKAGLANLASTLLDEGAGPYDSQAFQGRLQDLATSLNYDAARDGFTGSLRTLKDNAPAAFDLVRLSLTEPHVTAEALERMRSAILSSLKRDETDPNYITRRLFYATAYPDHPYGDEIRGTPETLAALTPGDVRAFVTRELTRDRLVIAAAGAITPDELATALDSMFGALPATTAAPPLPEVTAKGAGETLVALRPIPQTFIMMGQPGVKRDDPDWFAAVVMNHVLGGGSFTSRLMTEVREKRGLTYGVYSAIYPLDHSALVLAGGSTRNATAGQALDIMRAEWRRMAEGGVTDEELADAKTYLTGSFPLQFTSTTAIAQILLQVKKNRLGIDYLDKRNDYINGVTREDVARVARRLLDPDTLLTVLVGQPEGVTATRTLQGGS